MPFLFFLEYLNIFCCLTLTYIVFTTKNINVVRFKNKIKLYEPNVLPVHLKNIQNTNQHDMYLRFYARHVNRLLTMTQSNMVILCEFIKCCISSTVKAGFKKLFNVCLVFDIFLSFSTLQKYPP